MQTQKMFIPFYCNNCHQLAFIYKSDGLQETIVLELYKANWRNHLCYSIKKEEIWSHQTDLPVIEWGAREIPVKFHNKSKKTRSNQLNLGVIIELPIISDDNAQKGFFKVLTLENSIVYLRSVEQQQIASAGILVDLSTAKKIGTDKYRVPKIVQVNPEIEKDNLKEDLNSFFSFILSANDQEQLESFVDRFLKMLSQKNLYLESITPLENQPESQSFIYQRKLTVSSAYRLQKAIETMTFPESIRISMQ